MEFRIWNWQTKVPKRKWEYPDWQQLKPLMVCDDLREFEKRILDGADKALIATIAYLER
jgi:hypothetical protein